MSWMKTFMLESIGSVMMEYVIVSSIFLLGVGGLVKLDGGKYTNLFFQAATLDKSYSTMTLEDSEDGHLDLVPVLEAERELKSYGMVGDAWARQSRLAQKVIAMPIP